LNAQAPIKQRSKINGLATTSKQNKNASMNQNRLEMLKGNAMQRMLAKCSNDAEKKEKNREK
jgi:hypothetical protein